MRTGAAPPADPRSDPRTKASPNTATSAPNSELLAPSSDVANGSSTTLKTPPKNMAPVEAAIKTLMAPIPATAFRPSRTSPMSEGRSSSSTGVPTRSSCSRVSTNAEIANVTPLATSKSSGPTSNSAPAATAGPTGVAEIRNSAIQRRCRRQSIGADQRRKACQGGGAEESGAESGYQRERKGREEAIHQRERYKGCGAYCVPEDHAPPTRPPAISEAPSDGAEKVSKRSPASSTKLIAHGEWNLS